VAQLSIGYEGLVRELSTPLITAEVGKVLLGAAGDRYERMYPECSPVQFTQSGRPTSSISPVPWAQDRRTARWRPWTITPATIGKRDVTYQRKVDSSILSLTTQTLRS
jgi:hypothetical protein